MFWKTGQSVLIAMCVSKKIYFVLFFNFCFESIGIKALSAYIAITLIYQKTVLRLPLLIAHSRSAAASVCYGDWVKRIEFGLLFGIHYK